MTQTLNIKTLTAMGDGDKPYAQVFIGDVTVTVYESLSEPGVIVCDVDTDDAPTNLAVAVNDYYIHGRWSP